MYVAHARDADALEPVLPLPGHGVGRAADYAQQHKPPKRRRHKYGLQQQHQQHQLPLPQQQQQQPPPLPQQQTPSPPPSMRAQPPSRRALRYTPAHWHGRLKPQLLVRVFDSCPLHCWHHLGPQPRLRQWCFFPAATCLRRTRRASAYAGSAACLTATRTGSVSRSGALNCVRPVPREDEARRAPRYSGLRERKSAGADDCALLVAPRPRAFAVPVRARALCGPEPARVG
ncbi:hypothetical protein DFH11DRAFT_460988 [Phellopilus nigrolimitatus]|nr:hypothetical protein DFH11DRAFT_460988 [Phellopilus nigrolimitatus]